MTDCRFFTFHGWGFDSGFWNPWTDFLSRFGSVEAFDRGYFHNPSEINMVDRKGPSVIITHSFGLHFLDEEWLKEADLLIIAGGFFHFHPHSSLYRKRSRLILKQMIREFAKNPRDVLNNFYQNCFAPLEPTVEVKECNHGLLLADLERLHQSKMDRQWLQNVAEICILHGSEDRVVPRRKGRELFNLLGDKAAYFEMKGAGHALTYTHPRPCLEFIRPRLEQLSGRLKAE